mmetsp:Transcript_26901/g.67627  ORF Transcript_26901/g.67627 Transcript_26901/m.67627 type:complete len:493 (-) Transcript_26901:66-1544(-)
MRCLLLLACCLAVQAGCSWAAPAPAPAPPSPPTPTVEWVVQPVNQLGFEPTQPPTFKQRVLIVDTWHQPGGPILFYTGNEGPIDEFYNNTGFPFELAPSIGALVVFAEHRYYGESLPFPTDVCFQPHNMRFLSVEQSLADYTAVVQHLHLSRPSTRESVVVALGGSYGGMLSAWWRRLYPDVVHASLASSAPIVLLGGVVPSPTYYGIVTNDFKAVDERCPDLVRSGFSAMIDLADTDEGLETITSTFKLCKPLGKNDLDHMVKWIMNSLGSLAMMNYPYPTNFLAPLPGYPIRLACSEVLHATTPLAGLAAAADLFYNGTAGTLQCHDIYKEYISCADKTGCGTGPAGLSWDYQACTEIIYYPVTNNQTDMFPPTEWSLDLLTEYCQRTWGVTPRPEMSAVKFGLASFTGASRIIFSNGALDPWYSGGVRSELNPMLPFVWIEGSAHHLDLRFSNDLDPPSVTKARAHEVSILKRWIKEAQSEMLAKMRQD